MTTKRAESSHDRCGHPTKDVRPEPAEGLFSCSASVSMGGSAFPGSPRCTFSFADGRRCALPAHPQGRRPLLSPCPSPAPPPSSLRSHRELITPCGTLVPARKIRRVLAKLLIAVADGLFSPTEAGLLTHLCNLMLACNRQSRTKPLYNQSPTITTSSPLCLPTLMTSSPRSGLMANGL